MGDGRLRPNSIIEVYMDPLGNVGHNGSRRNPTSAEVVAQSS